MKTFKSKQEISVLPITKETTLEDIMKYAASVKNTSDSIHIEVAYCEGLTYPPYININFRVGDNPGIMYDLQTLKPLDDDSIYLHYDKDSNKFKSTTKTELQENYTEAVATELSDRWSEDCKIDGLWQRIDDCACSKCIHFIDKGHFHMCAIKLSEWRKQ